MDGGVVTEKRRTPQDTREHYAQYNRQTTSLRSHRPLWPAAAATACSFIAMWCETTRLYLSQPTRKVRCQLVPTKDKRPWCLSAFGLCKGVAIGPQKEARLGGFACYFGRLFGVIGRFVLLGLFGPSTPVRWSAGPLGDQRLVLRAMCGGMRV